MTQPVESVSARRAALTHGSLFAGIGGFDLGFERAGFKTVWQVEINEYCRRVLATHFPDARRYDDIRICCGEPGYHGRCLATWHLPRVDVVTGGFPCQDVSKAGNRAGIAEGTRSGLWFEMRRIICELRPRYAVVENVPGLLERGIAIVLGELAEVGYDAEWDCLPAAAFGATHLRDRTFLVAYANGERPIYGQTGRLATEAWMQALCDIGPSCDDRQLRGQAEGGGWPFGDFKWLPEPALARMVDGIPSELDKSAVTALGNVVVPQVAYWIASRIKPYLTGAL